MKGLTQDEILKKREEIKRTFQDQGWTFVETMQDTLPANVASVSLGLLAAGLMNMAKCNYVIFLKGWRSARGCRIEHDVCEAYGIKTIEFD